MWRFHELKLSYIPAQLRVRCEFSQAIASRLSSVPSEIIDRAIEKLEGEIEAGNAAFYFSYPERLRHTWQTFADSQEGPMTKIAVTVAAGSPHLPGLRLAEHQNPSVVASLSIDARAEDVRSWKFPFVSLSVRNFLREAGHDRVIPNAAEICNAWLLASAGIKVEEHLVHEALPLHDEDAVKGYEIRIDPAGGFISVCVADTFCFVDGRRRQAFKSEIKDAIVGAGKKFACSYMVLFENLVRILRSAHRGPERLKIDVPLNVLVAARLPYHPDFLTKKHILIEERKVELIEETEFQAPAVKRVFSFTVSPDKMSVTIAGVAHRVRHRITIALLRKELEEDGIHLQLSEHEASNLHVFLQSSQPLVGYEVARGISPLPPEEPFLTFPFAVPAEDQGDSADVRKLGGRYVRKGQLVASIGFRIPGIPGRDVYGNELLAPFTGTFAVAMGEGVERRGLDFYSLRDGIPKMDASGVDVAGTFIHQGNVDFASGNIHFGGGLEIHGDICAGTEVVVQGDLHVTGSISSAKIIVHGSLSVVEGITASRIFVRGAMKAKFVESSTLICEHGLVVEGSMVNCKAYVYEGVEITGAPGSVVGGELVCGWRLIAQEVGRHDGALTTIHGGEDVRAMRRQVVLTQRRSKLQDALERETANFNELKQRSPEAMSAKMANVEARLKERVKRMEKLLRKIHEQLRGTSARHFNDKAFVEVRGALSLNSSISLCRKPATLKAELAGVMVFLRNGSVEVRPIEESDVQSA